jgi:transcriptional regulator with XRE-family HTH domain
MDYKLTLELEMELYSVNAKYSIIYCVGAINICRNLPYSADMKNTELLVCIGKQIRMLRKEKGLSQEQLSELIGLHPTSLSGIERGTVSSKIGNYASLAQALGVTLSELVDTTTDFGNSDRESWRVARILIEKLKGLDSKKRAVYLDAANKLFERVESI